MLAVYGGLAKAFVCVVKPVSAAKGYVSPRSDSWHQRLKCTPLRMAVSRHGVDSVGEKQRMQQV